MDTLIQSKRFLSLDIFRGLTIALMILVNTPGTGAEFYGFLTHVGWFGFTLADLVFPSFLFAVGNSMSFSMEKLKSGPSQDFWIKIIRRTLIIFILGYLMYWFPFFSINENGIFTWKPFSETRIMGVLQRIALSYFLASILIRYLSERSLIIISILILLSYWGILCLGIDSVNGLTMSNNIVSKIDLKILGLGHIYKKDAIPFDPEGLLSTLPSIINVIGGYFAGVFIQKKGKTFESIALLLISGFVLLILAEWWNLIFPISKKLWTSSFVLYTVGIDLSLMAVLVWAIELKRIKLGFFDIFGKNPLFIYLFSELFYTILRMIPVTKENDVFEWVSERIFQQIFPGAFGSLMTAIAYLFLCWFMGWWLNKKRIYIKI